jgi:serine/threonine-protein kinase
MREEAYPLPKIIGDYQIERSLGQGGMGEVFLAFDPVCKRQIALKQIRKDLSQNTSLQKRFLREALIAAHLSHPSIIPIYSIHREDKNVFYTMPFVEGQTLKQIIKISQEQEREGEIKHPIGASIPSLANIFLKVCQAIAYAHSKGVLHRDLKPDNIIVGKYGEVLLFDWGLADVIENKDATFSTALPISAELTKPGKIPGTLLYLAPERVLGGASTTQTDIYALGVILYQILTLQSPFHRKSVDNLRKIIHLERVIDPLEIAPYRDIPEHLADVVKRCLRFNPQERFQSVDEILSEINSYIEGRPEWIPTAQLDIENKNDWEFQENILLARHMAITRSPDVLEWVSLMISRMSFTGNMRLETKVKINENGSGVGILLAIPEASERKGLIEEGYYLWIGSEKQPGLRIFQFNVEVMSLADFSLKTNTWHHLSIELVDNHLHIYLDKTKHCHYISHVPMAGTHIGLLFKDADFVIEPLHVFLGSQNAMVNCLAIPDIFLANKNYAKALIEYRRIASCFSGRTEGREALFRAGITLLQQGLHQKSFKEKDKLYAAAHDEFGKLRFTPGAPLEYLGKSLIYKELRDIEEEEKCLELALRKYPKHPLIKVIVEHILFRLHESSNRDRIAAFHFLLLAAGHLPAIFSIEDNARLFNSLKAHLDTLAFLLPLQPEADASEERLYVAVQIAFWLAKPIPLIEMIESRLSPFILSNAFLCLLVLDDQEWIQPHVHLCSEPENLKCTLLARKEGAAASIEKLLGQNLTSFSLRCIYYLMEKELMLGKSASLLAHLPRLHEVIKEDKIHFDALFIWIYLLNAKWKEAQELLERYPQEVLTDEYSPLYPLMGCWLQATEGAEIALTHFSGSMEVPYPSTTLLLSFFLRGKISEKKGWIATAFSWEKIQLFRQLHLYYTCADEPQRAKHFLHLMKRELKRVHAQHPYS